MRSAGISTIRISFKTGLLPCVLICLAFGCKSKKASLLFESVPSAQSHITFSNNLTSTDTLNILDYNYFYNGGGVGAADFNNDGLTDLYFTGNQVSSKLYLNKGNFSFEDVTAKAGVSTSNWATGVAIADINNDGLQDMYVSFAGYKSPERRVHQLFVNKGVGKDGIPKFEDQAAAYGLADTSYTSQSSFFDYDQDGDLDLLLVNHYQDLSNPNYPLEKIADGLSPSNARLYRNDGLKFTEVAKMAGIRDEGYGLSASISDINHDGWPDIYIAKDFVYDDALYINNRNGTFTESIHQYLAHTAQFSMGSDIADFNNDTYPDIVTVDMLPDDNDRQKLMNIATNNDRYNYTLQLGYMPQYSRNMLQLNNGPDAEGRFSFSEIGQLAGVYKTDWSWSPLFADLDNDGWKDLYITNGIPKDITNNDFVAYRAEQIMNNTTASFTALKAQMLGQIEALENVDKPNYVFQNNRNLGFTNQSESWGLAVKGFSNGAVYADLDNDGDLDLVTNNINALAAVYRNRSREVNGHNFLRVKLDGPAAAGAKVIVFSGGQAQYQEHTTVRGFQSSQEPVIHFGLGKSTVVDSLKVVWPGGKVQVMQNIKPNQVMVLRHNAATEVQGSTPAPSSALLRDVTATTGIDFTHVQHPFEDFNHEPLLPHRFSVNGPFLAAGDVDGNGYEDLWVSGPARVPGKLFLQGADGRFAAKNMPDSGYEDMGGVFLDADKDKDLDLYVVSGGNVYNPLTAPYQDRLYFNDGKGNFTMAESALPVEYASGSVAAANDFDKDGDMDLFVGGRVVPTRYPLSPESFILKNDGSGRFENATASVCAELSNIGMVTTALWSDFDNDGWTDLIVAGEWMPVSFFKNNRGQLTMLKNNPALQAATGWWFNLAGADFDKDGDTDYIGGNLGLNNKYHATEKTPLSVYAKDFDGNGMMECLLTYYLNGKEYTLANRDQINSVLPVIKKKYDNYTKFARADFASMFSGDELADVLKLQATNFASVYIENKGGGNFQLHALPLQAQFSAIQGILPGDYDNDGHLDILVGGNFYNPDFMTGRYDASVGLLLKGDGRGKFQPLPPSRSGIHINGDTRSLLSLTVGKKPVVAAGVNKGKMVIYGLNR